MGGKILLGLPLLYNFGFTALYTFSLTIANTFVFNKLDLIYCKNRFSTQRIILGFVGSFLVSVLVIFVLRIFEEVILKKNSFSYYLEHEQIQNFLVTILITFIVTLSIYTIHFYRLYNENRVKEHQIIAGTASAKFETLKNQIDPHFLFNSLNVLSSLIEENPENAQKFTTSLSKIYRYVLEQKDKDLVTVQEELAFAKTYMNLLKMRFENSITFDLPENFELSEAKVVPLSLQLLLENTIKHNIVSEQKPLHISILIKDNYLVVQNNLQKKEVLQDRKGVGLQNIISRYHLLSNRKVLIEQNKDLFSVHIPILTRQISVLEVPKYIENTKYQKARRRVKELKEFYGNLISYCTIMPLLVFINLYSHNHFQWFWFPLIGWGGGLIFHALSVFSINSQWEQKKIEKILQKDILNQQKLN